MILSTGYLLHHTVPLLWADVLWAYRKGLIGWRTPVDLARAGLNVGEHRDPQELELASMGKDEDWKVSPLLEQLAERIHVPEAVSKRKWLYLALLSLFERRDELEDPFGDVEEVYVDFGYPDEVSPFVRYMPPVDEWDPRSHSPLENEKRMLDKWREYLDRARYDLI